MTTMIIRMELSPVILSPLSRLTKKMLSVTKTIDRAKDKAILSRTLSGLKKIRLQIKPGRTKTSTIPNIALIDSNCSRNEKTNPKYSLTDVIKSALLMPPYRYPQQAVI